MNNTNALLDRAKALCKPDTDYQLAKRLGIAHQTISRCRNHGGTLDNAAVLRLAQLLEQDFQHVLALVELDRARTEKARAFWESIAPRLVSSLVIGVIATTTGGVSEEAHSTPFIVKTSTSPAIHYANWKARMKRFCEGQEGRRLRAAARWLREVCPVYWTCAG